MDSCLYTINTRFCGVEDAHITVRPGVYGFAILEEDAMGSQWQADFQGYTSLTLQLITHLSGLVQSMGSE
jgi:hypothetical protein